MAYKIIRTATYEEQTGVEITAILDTAGELDALGTNWAPGSIAFVADSGLPTYVLNASGEWKET